MNKNATIIIKRGSFLSKRMVIMLVALGLLFGGIFTYKVFQDYMMKKQMSGLAAAPITVSSTIVSALPWEPKLTATGSVRAINGVDVTTEIVGLITRIHFIPGQDIQRGDVILELNADPEIAQLKSLEALADLAQINYDRDTKQLKAQSVSQATVDADEANLKNARAQVDQQAATLAKKTIRAPFSGRLGISAINLGQFLNPGDKIVTLQSLDPIYVDFFLPQQKLPQITINQTIFLKTDTYPGVSFEGKITTINPKVDIDTRNVEVEATLSNPDHKLLPGMYGVVEIHTGAPKDYLTLPQTAISYNPYGDLVYILTEKGKDKNGSQIYIAHQKFVTLGETRGDQVQILKGIEKGDLVVTAGQLKLKNGSLVTINNTVLPKNDPAPRPKNE
ncbi:MAG: efflux transporter periplasmic adaptor subunit [Alphaproteobacteria bacterium 41-28]|nr:MAG: efflux transporter periplasmic adaptor subunit [Alphaproteobacteria bacterium 41-28]